MAQVSLVRSTHWIRYFQFKINAEFELFVDLKYADEHLYVASMVRYHGVLIQYAQLNRVKAIFYHII